MARIGGDVERRATSSSACFALSSASSNTVISYCPSASDSVRNAERPRGEERNLIAVSTPASLSGCRSFSGCSSLFEPETPSFLSNPS